MPVKISTTTDPENGEISKADLTKIIGDFHDYAEITSSSGTPFKKTDGLSIPFSIFKKLIDDSFAFDGDADKYVNIFFAITLPGQTSCVDGSDISNSLTAVVSVGKINVDEEIIDRTEIDDEIITIGFKPHADEAATSSAPASLTALAAPAASAALVACCGHPKGTP